MVLLTYDPILLCVITLLAGFPDNVVPVVQRMEQMLLPLTTQPSRYLRILSSSFADPCAPNSQSASQAAKTRAPQFTVHQHSLKTPVLLARLNDRILLSQQRHLLRKSGHSLICSQKIVAH